LGYKCVLGKQDHQQKKYSEPKFDENKFITPAVKIILHNGIKLFGTVGNKLINIEPQETAIVCYTLI
jgi:hypothetical protein